jgi:hypothetical protein
MQVWQTERKRGRQGEGEGEGEGRIYLTEDELFPFSTLCQLPPALPVRIDLQAVHTGDLAMLDRQGCDIPALQGRDAVDVGISHQRAVDVLTGPCAWQCVCDCRRHIA